MTQELLAIQRAKELARYVMDATGKSPARYRFTFVSRLQNLSLDIIEDIYLANEVFVGAGRAQEAVRERLTLQHRALTKVKLLAYVALLACEQCCILDKQFEQIAHLTTDCQRLLGAWIKSDRKRPESRS